MRASLSLALLSGASTAFQITAPRLRVNLPSGAPWRYQGRHTGRHADLRASARPESLEKHNMPEQGTIKREMREWASGAKPEGYEKSKIVVTAARTLPQVYGALFKAVRECVEVKYGAESGDSGFSGHMLFVAPYCLVLHDYDMMRQVDKVLDFSSGACVGFGEVVTLQHYHPFFGKEPPPSASAGKDKPTRHAPYPAFGLSIPTGDPAPSPPGPKDRVQKARLYLELLYNTAATSSSSDVLDSHGAVLGRAPASAEEALAKTKAWVAAVRNIAAAGATAAAGASPATAASAPWTAHLDTILQYTVSGSNSAEEVFADLFNAIDELIGKAEDAECRAGAAAPAHAGGEDSEEPCVSTVFVAPRFQSFNAAGFQQFGATFATALAQSPILDRFKVEVFHPELVCEGGVVDRSRRSPFPVLHIMHTGLKAQLIPPKQKKEVVAVVAEEGREDGEAMLEASQGNDSESEGMPASAEGSQL